jgi:hypothetical protein
MAYFPNADKHNKLKRINLLASNHHLVGTLEKVQGKISKIYTALEPRKTKVRRHKPGSNQLSVNLTE